MLLPPSRRSKCQSDAPAGLNYSWPPPLSAPQRGAQFASRAYLRPTAVLRCVTDAVAYHVSHIKLYCSMVGKLGERYRPNSTSTQCRYGDGLRSYACMLALRLLHTSGCNPCPSPHARLPRHVQYCTVHILLRPRDPTTRHP